MLVLLGYPTFCRGLPKVGVPLLGLPTTDRDYGILGSVLGSPCLTKLGLLGPCWGLSLAGLWLRIPGGGIKVRRGGGVLAPKSTCTLSKRGPPCYSRGFGRGRAFSRFPLGEEGIAMGRSVYSGPVANPQNCPRDNASTTLRVPRCILQQPF